MPQSRGSCGHKRGDWDTHSKCLSCCGCSRLAPCPISALWASDIWAIAESRRAHRSRRGTRSPLSVGSSGSHRSRELSGDIRPLFESPVRVTPAGSPYSPSDSPPGTSPSGSSPVSPGRPRFPGFPAGETAALSSSLLDMVTAEPSGSGPSRSPSPALLFPRAGPNLWYGSSDSGQWVCPVGFQIPCPPASRSSDTGHRASGNSHRAIHSEHRPKALRAVLGPPGTSCPVKSPQLRTYPAGYPVPGRAPGMYRVPG